MNFSIRESQTIIQEIISEESDYLLAHKEEWNLGDI